VKGETEARGNAKILFRKSPQNVRKSGGSKKGPFLQKNYTGEGLLQSGTGKERKRVVKGFKGEEPRNQREKLEVKMPRDLLRHE